MAALRSEIMSRWEKSVTGAKANRQSSGADDPSSLQNKGFGGSGDPSHRNGENKSHGDQLDEILRIASESADKSGNPSKSKSVSDPKLRAAILSTMSDVSLTTLQLLYLYLSMKLKFI